jgi:hypothetical protein
MKVGIEQDGCDREDAIVAALVLMHRRREEAQARATGSEYQRVVSQFERQGERLRGERLAARELVGRMLGTHQVLKRAEVQQELEMRGPRGGVAVGRIRIRNAAERARAFELSIGEPLSGGAAPVISLEPPRGRLPPGGTALLRVEAQLRMVAMAEPVTLPLHCHWDAGLERIWLVVRAEPSGELR